MTEFNVPKGGKVLTLPSGFQVVLKGTESLRNRERKAVLTAAARVSEDQASMAVGMLDLIAAALIVEWDVRVIDEDGEPTGEVLPLPSIDPESMDELMPGDAQVLTEETKAAKEALFPDFSPNPDPESPTRPSAG